MNKLIAGLVLVIGVGALFGLKFYTDNQSNQYQLQTSDAVDIKHRLNLGMDSWAGYYQLCSKHFSNELRRQAINLNCIDDQADLVSRFEKLKSGELDFAVTTLDAYLALGEKTGFPGTIIAVIDESKGGDALVSWQNEIGSIDDLKTKQPQIALTTDSPSEHLLRSLAVHFDVEYLKKRGSWLKATNGSNDAKKQLLSKQVEAAVLWEPDVTQALKTKGITKIIGSEDTKRLIVDVLLVSRDMAKNSPDIVETILQQYFNSLDYYQKNAAQLQKEYSDKTGLNNGDVQAMLKGVAWQNLSNNVFQWFSISNQGLNNQLLLESLKDNFAILQQSGHMEINPLPNQSFYTIINRQFIENIYQKNQQSIVQSQDFSQQFSQLSLDEWKSLTDVGTLKIRKISFTSSNAQLSEEAKRLLDTAAQDLSHYPNFRVLVKGHTGLSGDQDANNQLSQNRAQAVVRYLNIAHGIDEHRIKALGVGSQEPLTRLVNESNRAYKYRLPRVELLLKAN